MVLPCKSDHIYAIYLVGKDKGFQYKGYESLTQIGKYYTVTLSTKTTRLYTLVNFLQK